MEGSEQEGYFEVEDDFAGVEVDGSVELDSFGVEADFGSGGRGPFGGWLVVRELFRVGFEGLVGDFFGHFVGEVVLDRVLRHVVRIRVLKVGR